MPTKITFELSPEGLSLNMGSLFHGYLMDIIDTYYAEYLHYNGTNPYTSSVFQDYQSKKFYWRITTFNKEAYEKLIIPFLENNPSEITLAHRSRQVHIKGFQLHTCDYEELYLNAERTPKIRLLTPTSFKSQGITHIFPDISTLLQGVINKINTHSDNFKWQDEECIQELLQKTYIRDYNLRTSNFSLEGIKIKGFVGTIQPAVNDEALLPLLNFLLAVSEYTGFGIKTALGMGAVKCEWNNI